ncbi:MAG: hypothetical protein V8R81_01285 [Clostridia bacterium]
MKIVNKKKFIVRILEVAVLIGTFILTPIAINYANSLRGYKAFGGEYLIPVLGLTMIMIIETIFEENQKPKRGGKHAKR